ncbi:hypothetical protein TNCV_3338651 [Trichonephila clavipes]|nr:hypothetical protein TNCV_3338651 [Trichonephila clavipes]
MTKTTSLLALLSKLPYHAKSNDRLNVYRSPPHNGNLGMCSKWDTDGVGFPLGAVFAVVRNILSFTKKLPEDCVKRCSSPIAKSAMSQMELRGSSSFCIKDLSRAITQAASGQMEQSSK